MASQFLNDLTDTWNAATTAFNAIRMSVSDIASAAASRLIDLKVNGNDRFSVDKNGNVSASGAIKGASLELSQALPVAGGGTGATTAAGARTALGLGLVTNKSETQLAASGPIADALAAKVAAANVGAANGVAALDANGKVPLSQLSDSVVGNVNWIGTWNASTNSPAIPAAAAANKGQYRIVNVAGATSINGITDWKVGDWIISNGIAWEKVDNTDQVMMVAGRVGNIVLTAADISDSGATGRSLMQDATPAAARDHLELGNVLNVAQVAKNGDRMNGPLSSKVVAHGSKGAVTEVFNYADGNVHSVTVEGAMTINPTNLAEGDVMQINVTFASGSIAVSGTTYWELGGGMKSTALADLGLALSATAPAGRYRIVFEMVGGRRMGVFQ